MSRPKFRPMSLTAERLDAAPFIPVVLLALVLAACTADGRAPVVAAFDERPTSVAAPIPAKPIEPVEPVGPPITARLTPPAEPAPTPPVVLPRRAEPPAKPPPIQLVGLSGEKVADVLGRPHHVWREPPAAVWQYRATGCVLHVFFYPAAGDRLQVVHVTRRRASTPARQTTGAKHRVSTVFSDELCRRVDSAQGR